jgi:hypothetical protein
MAHRGDDNRNTNRSTGGGMMMLRRIILIGVAYYSSCVCITTTDAFGVGPSVKSIAKKIWGASSWRKSTQQRERAFLRHMDESDKGDDDIPGKKTNNMFQWKSDDKSLSSALGIDPDDHDTNKQPQPPSTPPPASVWKSVLPFFAGSDKKETTKSQPMTDVPSSSSVVVGADVSIPYDAAAQLSFADSDKSLTFEEFQRQYEADTVAYVTSKQPGNISIPYHAAARLAYDNNASAKKSMTFTQFKTKYEADAIALVKSKQSTTQTAEPEQTMPPKETTKPVMMTPVKVEIPNEMKEAGNKMFKEAGNKLVKEVVVSK